MSDICTAQWQDDHGKDHECFDDADHAGGHECGCGARVPRWLLEAATGDRATVRAEVAGEIRAHAERHAPAGFPLNHPRTVLRRHLLLAARIADGPLTEDDLAHIAAQVVGLVRPATTTRSGAPGVEVTFDAADRRTFTGEDA